MADPQASGAIYRSQVFPNEGLKYLDYLAGRERTPPGEALDVVFVAFGFDYQPSTWPIGEMGVACLDTRRLNLPAAVRPSVSEGPLTETWRYKGDEHGLADHEVRTSMTQHLRIRDAHSSDPAALRDVVLVGSPVWSDFDVLERVGGDFGSLTHVLATMDVAALRGQLIPPNNDVTPAAFEQWLRLNPPPPGWDISGSTAATRAAYALHSLLRLAVKRAETSPLAQSPLPAENAKALASLRAAVSTRPKYAKGERNGADAAKDQG